MPAAVGDGDMWSTLFAFTFLIAVVLSLAAIRLDLTDRGVIPFHAARLGNRIKFSGAAQVLPSRRFRGLRHRPDRGGRLRRDRCAPGIRLM
jgi:hypothetical protein